MTGVGSQAAGRGLVGNSIALLATTHVTAVLGYIFWTVCARSFPASVIGVVNTVISAMTLVAVVTVAGFVPMLTRLLPGLTAGNRGRLCATALSTTAVASGFAGAIAALLMPGRLEAEVGFGWLVALLVVGSIATASLLVVNASLLGVRRADLSLVGGVAGSACRLGAIAIALASGALAVGIDVGQSHAILMIWVASLIISLVLSIWLLTRTSIVFSFRPSRIWLVRTTRSVGWDHIAALAIRAPPLLIPILAAAHLPPEQVGYLAVVVMILSVFVAVAASVANSLLADCADDPQRLRKQAVRASRLIGWMLILPVLITCFFAERVLSLFGPAYATASLLLVILLVSTLPDAVINIAVAILRVRGHLAVVAALAVAGAAISTGGAWILMPHNGILGAGWAVLFSQTAVAITSVVVVRRRPVTETHPHVRHGIDVNSANEAVMRARTGQ